MSQECPTCGRGATALEEMLVEARQQLQDLDREFKAAIREKGRLKAELAKQRQDSPDAKEAQEVFDHWVATLGKNGNVVFGPAREKAVLARLKEYPVDLLKRAVEGCALVPFVGPHGRQAKGGKGAKRFDDLSLICRDETTVERFAAYVDEYEAKAVERQAEARAFVEDRYGTDVSGQVRWGGSYREVDGSFEPGGLHALLDALGRHDCDVSGSGARFMAQCPAHDDRDPSLSISEKPDGRVLIYCHAGCKSLDVLRAVGLEFADIGGACALSPAAAQRTFGALA